MTEILDDFSDIHLSEERLKYYVSFSLLILLLMNGGAYLQAEKMIQLTPIFEEYAGWLAMAILLWTTTACYRKVVRESWLKSVLVGIVIMVIDFTIIFQMVMLFEKEDFNNLFPFWTYLSIGYSLISIAVMEFFGRRADAKYNKALQLRD